MALPDATFTLLSAVPAMVVVGCLVLFVVGLRAMRADPVAGLDVDDLVLLREGERERAGGLGPLERLAKPLVPLVLRTMGSGGRTRLARTIDLAGRPDGVDVEAVALRISVWLLIMGPLVLILFIQGVWWAVVPALVVVVALPLGGIARARRLRQERLSRDLPDFLDVLAVTVTAGVGFRAALATVADRFGGPLAEEVTLTLDQIRNGASVREAFRRLRARNDSQPLSAFVTAYLQSEELGAPLVQTLTRIAQDMRRDSAQRQRQQAGRVAPRVTLVTSMVLVPGALAILVVGFVLGIDVNFGDVIDGAP